jgi:hypothetical protein
MMNQKRLDCLAAHSASRTVNLLQNRQVALTWDRVTTTMRMTDLLTLHQALRAYMADDQRPWAATYVVSLTHCRLFIHDTDLYGFCTIIQEAVEQLPRRVVRWIDFAVTITPYCVESSSVGCFSAN